MIIMHYGSGSFKGLRLRKQVTVDVLDGRMRSTKINLLDSILRITWRLRYILFCSTFFGWLLVVLCIRQETWNRCPQDIRGTISLSQYLDSTIPVNLTEVNQSSIHLSFVVGGASATRQVVVLIKSILVHRLSSQSCLMSSVKPDQLDYKLVLHFIVDEQANKSLSALFESWHIDQLEVYFYLLKPYENQVSWIPTNHYSGIFGLSKLIISTILPKTVTKVMHLDVDLLVNSDISELWRYFDQFNQTQALGIVKNQSPWYLKGSNNAVWPARGTGYNTGVMLLKLDRLQQIQWNDKWQLVAKVGLTRIPYAPLADQDIINTVLINMSSLLFELPCEWNFQLTSNKNISQCKAGWTINRIGDLKLKIAHFNHPIKADAIGMDGFGQDMDPLRLQLRSQFVQYYRYYQNLDGSLLKASHRPLFSGECSHSSRSDQSFTVPTQTSNQIRTRTMGCEEFELEQLLKRRVHPFYLTHSFTCTEIPHCSKRNDSKIKSDVDQISLVSQLSFDRLHRLEELALRWFGPMSLALYLTDREAALLVEYVTNSRILSQRTNIGYHVVYIEGKFYPINALRNIAMHYATTNHVFHIDVDFLPNQNIYERLQSTIRMYNPTGTKNCLVVPAFESFRSHLNFPETKDDLISLWNQGEIVPFRHEIWSAGHMSTNYSKWKTANEDYYVEWSADYEPYVVVPRTAARFDQRFVGFGWNKAAFTMALDALGYRFLVLHNIFLIHLPHPPSLEVFRFRMNPTYRSCIDKLKLDYIKHLARTHGVQALKYLQFRKDNPHTVQ